MARDWLRKSNSKFFDRAETNSQRSIDRMAGQGGFCVER
jgi:hypothetical protein